MNETRDIHPLVTLWLTQNGYSYVHEYKLPDYGRVDFYATHSDGHTLLVECKGRNPYQVITQLAGYSIQFPEAKLAIGIATSEITEKIRRVADKYSVRIIEFPFFEAPKPKSERTANSDGWFQIMGNRAENARAIIYNPRFVLAQVLLWHKERNSTPLLELFVLYHSVSQSPEDIYPDEVMNIAADFYINAIMDILSEYPPEYNAIAMELFGHTKALSVLAKLSGTSKW